MPRIDTRFIQDSAVTAAKIAADATPTWHKYTVAESAFTAAAVTENIELFSLPAKGIIHSVIIKHTTSFTGGGLTGFTLSLGIAGSLAKYATAFDVYQATGATATQASNSLDVENFSSATSIRLAAEGTNANVNAATAGSVDVYVLWGLLP